MRKFTLKLLFTALTVLGIAFNANAQIGGGDADITAYSFAEQTGDATITTPLLGQNGKVEIEVSYGTDLNGLIATFELSTDATAEVNGTAQTSGVTPNNFTEDVALVYTVTASDGTTTQDWDVIVSIADASSEKDIIDFNLPNQIGDETISTFNYTVDVTVAQGTDVNSLIADFILSDNATANINGTEQVSGSTSNNFSNDVIYTVVAQDGTEQDWTVTVTVSTEDNTEANITAYSFAEQTGAATITEPVYSGQNGTIDIQVAYGTDLTSLVATFELSYGASADIAGTPQTSGSSSNDFTSTVTYTITAEDGTTTVDWDVNVTIAQNDQNNILSYSFAEQTGAANINTSNHSINIEVETGTNLTNLVATFTLSDNASAKIGSTEQESGVTANDFSDDVIYTVTAENGDTQDWTIIVTEATEENTEANIIAYSFAEQTGAANINTSNHSINIEVENGTNLTNLVATFTLSDNASAKIGSTVQESGVTANDFSDDVIYTVTAENGDTQDWTIIVTEAATISVNLINDYKVNIYPNPSSGIINITNSKNAKLTVINTNGKTIISTIITENTIDLSDLNSGLYYLRIVNDDNIIIKTISIY